LMIVANAVGVAPASTERLNGSTAATSGLSPDDGFDGVNSATLVRPFISVVAVAAAALGLVVLAAGVAFGLVVLVNWTKMRLLLRSNGMAPVALTKTAKVGVSPALIVRVTLGPGGWRHWPEVGSVWHRVRVTGKVAGPVFADAVMLAPMPWLVVLTENSADPVFGPVWLRARMPLLLFATAAVVMMFATGVVAAERNRVLIPVSTVACCGILAQAKLNVTLPPGAMAAVGVREMLKLAVPPAGILTGVFGLPPATAW